MGPRAVSNASLRIQRPTKQKNTTRDSPLSKRPLSRVSALDGLRSRAPARDFASVYAVASVVGSLRNERVLGAFTLRDGEAA